MGDFPKNSRLRSSILWGIAIILMFSAVVYQRATGPTYPVKGYLSEGNQKAKYKLIRSDWSNKTNDEAKVQVPKLSDNWTGQLHFKRYRTQDEMQVIDMVSGVNKKGSPILEAGLPAQPAAGKLSYYVTLNDGKTDIRIPSSDKETIIIRFKDHVPSYILIPHVVMMFFAVLIGMRAGLGAIWGPYSMRRWAWIAFIGMTVGGMVLGPIVQKFAFGEYWTGFPWGGDFTDNKMLLMWMAWLVAVGVSGLKSKPGRDLVSRWAIVIGSIVMTGVYLVPHSMGGSELDYSQLDKGVAPSEAITTGRK